MNPVAEVARISVGDDCGGVCLEKNQKMRGHVGSIAEEGDADGFVTNNVVAEFWLVQDGVPPGVPVKSQRRCVFDACARLEEGHGRPHRGDRQMDVKS